MAKRHGAARVSRRLGIFVAGGALLVPVPAAAQQGEPRVVTLEETIRLARGYDPPAVAAEAAVSTAQADVLQARGAFLPGITANGIYGNSSNQRFDQATGQLVSESYSAQLQGSLELFSGGRRLASLRAAGAGLEAADAEARATDFETVLMATETYYAAVAARALRDVAERRVERARQQHAFAQQRYEVGTVTTSDVLRAEIELANAELAAIEAETDVRATELELGRVVGAAGAVRPSATQLPERAPARPPLDVLVDRAVRSAPAVVAAEAEAASSRATRFVAYTPYLPSIRLAGGYDWFAFEFPPNQQSWSLRVIASLPVFNGFQREAAVQRARAFERVAEARARDATLAARVSVETAMQDIDLAERRVEVSSRTVGLAREDLRVQEERYQIGAATILDLQASQVALAEAEAGEIRARQELVGSVARLESILGETIGED